MVLNILLLDPFFYNRLPLEYHGVPACLKKKSYVAEQ